MRRSCGSGWRRRSRARMTERCLHWMTSERGRHLHGGVWNETYSRAAVTPLRCGFRRTHALRRGPVAEDAFPPTIDLLVVSTDAIIGRGRSAMSQTTGNTRLDPYKDFRIRLHDAGRSYTATMTAGLQSLGEIAEYRPGNDAGNSVRSPGPGHKYESIPLTRGVTPNSSFSQWASGLTLRVKETSPAPYRDLYVDFFNEAGQKLASFRLSGSFIFEIPIHPRGNPLLHVLRSPSVQGIPDRFSHAGCGRGGNGVDFLASVCFGTVLGSFSAPVSEHDARPLRVGSTRWRSPRRHGLDPEAAER